MQGKIGEGKSENGMVVEVKRMVFVRNLGGRQMLRFMRTAILVCVVW